MTRVASGEETVCGVLRPQPMATSLPLPLPLLV